MHIHALSGIGSLAIKLHVLFHWCEDCASLKSVDPRSVNSLSAHLCEASAVDEFSTVKKGSERQLDEH